MEVIEPPRINHLIKRQEGYYFLKYKRGQRNKGIMSFYYNNQMIKWACFNTFLDRRRIFKLWYKLYALHLPKKYEFFIQVQFDKPKR